jgi:hypothetical protein
VGVTVAAGFAAGGFCAAGAAFVVAGVCAAGACARMTGAACETSRATEVASAIHCFVVRIDKSLMTASPGNLLGGLAGLLRLSLRLAYQVWPDIDGAVNLSARV